MSGVADAFERELTSRMVAFKRMSDDEYEVVSSRGLLNVSIANLELTTEVLRIADDGIEAIACPPA